MGIPSVHSLSEPLETKPGAQRLQELVLLSFGGAERASSSTERSLLTAPLVKSAVGLFQLCSGLQNESR